MGLVLNLAGRKSVQVPVGKDGENDVFVTYLAPTGAQEDEQSDIINTGTFNKYHDLTKKHFWENIQGDENVIEALKKHIKENGGLSDFINECNTKLGKPKKKV